MREHSKQIRQKILATAKDLLVTQGYKKTTIRNIVQHSGVLTGSIYHFYQNKEAIFAEMLASIIHHCIEKIDACCGDETPAFKYAVICEVELTKMRDDARICEIYYECYHSRVIFEKMAELFARYAHQLFGTRFTEEEYRHKAVLIKGAMGACITAFYFDNPIDDDAARAEVIYLALRLFGVPEAEVEATIARMKQQKNLWSNIAQELVEEPLAI